MPADWSTGTVLLEYLSHVGFTQKSGSCALICGPKKKKHSKREKSQQVLQKCTSDLN